MLDIYDMPYEDDEFDELFENVSYLYYDDSVEISREEREKRVLRRLRPVPAFTCPVSARSVFLGRTEAAHLPFSGKSNRGKTASQRDRSPRPQVEKDFFSKSNR